MKEQILNWVKYDRSFSSGLALYLQHGKNLALRSALNRQGENDTTRKMLYEQLRALAGVDPEAWAEIIAVPVHNYKMQEKKKAEVPVEPEQPVEDIPVEPEPEKQVENIPETVEELKQFMPEGVKKAIKLREEFPFLKNADCPNALKILVADMISAYENYRQAHEKLFTAENEAEIENFAAETVENYLENRAIWEELNHYKESGDIMGKHPIFYELDEMAEIKKLSAKDLSKKKGNIRSNISRLEKSIAKGDKPELNNERMEKIASYKRLFDFVDQLLENK